MRKTIIASLLIFVAALACVRAEPANLRVVTWNLQWFPGGKPGAKKEAQDKQIELIRNQIKELKPDILLLQEVASVQALETTLKPLGDEWQVAIVSKFQGRQQVAIAARMPAEAAWAEAWKKGWANSPRGYAYAAFKIGDKRLAVYCLHLKSNLGEATGNRSKREDAMEQLVAHMSSKEERVLAADAIAIGGDFNTDQPEAGTTESPAERTFGILRKDGFAWAFEGKTKEERITCPKKDAYPDASFDHFWTKGLKAPLAVPMKMEGSDHLPVVLDIKL